MILEAEIFTSRWSGGRVQVWVQVWAPAYHLAISPKAVPEGNQRFTGQNQRPQLGSSLRLCLFGSDGRAQTQGVSMCLAVGLLGSGRRAQTQGVSKCLAVVAGNCLMLQQKMLPLLQYWHNSRVNEVLMLCKFLAVTSHFFSHVKWKFRWNWQEIVANQSSSHFFTQSFYQSLVSE